MTRRVLVLAIAVLAFADLTRAQLGFRRTPGAVYDVDFEGKKSGPAPRRSLSGTWEFAKGGAEGIQADGAKAMPSDGKPEHELPYTPEGRQAFMDHKPTYGITQVPSALTNDPMPGCDPQGFPRIVAGRSMAHLRRNHGGGDTRSADGWMTTRSSPNPTASTTEPG